jgi:hypothetical protein
MKVVIVIKHLVVFVLVHLPSGQIPGFDRFMEVPRGRHVILSVKIGESQVKGLFKVNLPHHDPL